jgi:hypothetical protein
MNDNGVYDNDKIVVIVIMIPITTKLITKLDYDEIACNNKI